MKKKLLLIGAILVLLTGLVFAQKAMNNDTAPAHVHGGGCCPGH